ncbi:MAG: cytochrome c peroxidase [Anaerolineales bacterium]|nr:MAG: cytochrome c peroxidase [Anaerolineales bacterium]
MNRKTLFSITALALALVLFSACSSATGEEAASEITDGMLGIFGTLPEEVTPSEYEMSEPLVDLGRMLYYEQRISINGQMSCNTCHGLNNYGMDGLRFSFGHSGNPVGRNSPTVYNAALHVAQFWDGRVPTVEEQAKGPILAGGEMGMPSGDYVVDVLKSIPGYLPYFQAAFPGDSDPITYDHVGQAIGAFERRLLTPGRFDDFLAGNMDALTEQEKRGFVLFIETGCASCHSGPALGGRMYTTLGTKEPYTTNDLGRYNVTQNEADKYSFKVPGLRNIAVTGPYLHDGSIPTLESMVQLMARHQLGNKLPDSQVDDMVTFMRALTGVLPSEYTAEPILPPNPEPVEAP